MPTNYDADRFAGQYLRARPLSAEFAATWTRLLAARIPADQVRVVADVGAGAGRFWPVFAAAWHPVAVVALDRSSAMLAGAATPPTTLPTVTRLVADMDALPLRPSGGLDVVFCSMALHYSRDPGAWVRATVATVRQGGWLCVRTGTVETLDSFDFLPYFPTALAAEHAAMPTTGELCTWFDSPMLEVTSVDVVAGGTPPPRRRAFAAACQRGFPSLQLVPRHELAWGLVRYGAHLLRAWTTGTARLPERSVLVTARRIV